MSAALSLVLAAGVLLVWDALTRPRRRRPGRSRVGTARDRADAWLVAAGVSVDAPRFAIGCVAAGVLGGALVLVVVGSSSIALLAAVAAGALPVAAARGRRTRLRRTRRAAWPEAIELLAGSVRAGDTLPAAIGVVAERGPVALRPEFAAVVADHRVSGDLAGALERMGTRLADPVADRVVVTLEVAHRLGGREPGRVLRTLAGFLRDDVALRREIDARQSWTRVAARVAVAAPWVVLLLVAARPDARSAYDTPAGFVVLVGGALVTALGYRMMLALGRLPDEPRVLTRGAAA